MTTLLGPIVSSRRAAACQLSFTLHPDFQQLFDLACSV